ncbi:energy-coupled thiamine transporter ThiT [Lacticaseibacillus brantae]|uniref:PTT family thiamin transporter n=1 Tax=Lacticaseibacillus brantae DSM 23927 TaxID=1423727 RepID=A0A0R2B0D9_9LACO|nr:energy-coupled thiamine transporter ThiT [Lacticaseibacillus brantae]KRM72501.1 PTT family thiamin transporter [Lacticaseibacillus brantae DSM 23927]
MAHQRLVTLVETAIIAAFAMALQYVPHTTGVSAIEFNYGLIPLAVLALRRGTVPALSAGFVWGMLDLMLRGSILNPVQAIIEYPVAFTVAGLMAVTLPQFQAALKNKQISKAIGMAAIGILVGTFAKYFFHFVAGWIYWGSYAPKGWPAWQWSLFVNGGSAVFSGILAIVVIGVLVTVAPRLFVAPKEAILQKHVDA